MHCLECGNYNDVVAAVCAACGKPFDSDGFFKAGMEAMALGEIDRGIDFLQKCVSIDEEHVSGRYNLGLALSLVNRCDEAEGHYMRVTETNPEYPGIYTALGQAAFGSFLSHSREAESQREAMVHYLMQAVEQDPNDVDAYFSLGNAYIALGSAEKSLPWLRGALRLHPDSPAIYFTMARALKMMGRYSEAMLLAGHSLELYEADDPFRGDVQELYDELKEQLLPL
ncbi:MAG: tetratricopeptide repeat protein [Armatimonadota bacterium]